MSTTGSEMSTDPPPFVTEPSSSEAPPRILLEEKQIKWKNRDEKQKHTDLKKRHFVHTMMYDPSLLAEAEFLGLGRT